ncbi:hypothetical protein MKW94_001558, partial [Papaver nudicaule]|nr:hypothetical protein [Papaver nudicaule]
MAAIADLGVKGDGQNDALKKLPLESLSIDIVVYIMRNVKLLDQFLEETSRVLKHEGTVLTQAPQPATLSTDKLGHLELQVLDLKSLIPAENVQSVTKNSSVKASKSSWKIGSSFSQKKGTPNLPYVQLDDDLVFIDEESLLAKKDLKKPELPVKEKVVKLGLTKEQIGNPQSAGGS